MLKGPLELVLERLLRSLGGSMRKREWVTPLVALTVTWLCLGTVSAIGSYNRYEPPRHSTY